MLGRVSGWPIPKRTGLPMRMRLQLDVQIDNESAVFLLLSTFRFNEILCAVSSSECLGTVSPSIVSCQIFFHRSTRHCLVSTDHLDTLRALLVMTVVSAIKVYSLQRIVAAREIQAGVRREAIICVRIAVQLSSSRLQTARVTSGSSGKDHHKDDQSSDTGENRDAN